MQIQHKEHSQLDEFKILRVLGSGNYATVKLGEDSNGIKVAIKKYKTETVSMQAVQNEIKIIKQFNHQNIVRFIACRPEAKYTKKDGTQYTCIVVILEYVGGGELFDFIADSGRFSQKVTRSYFGQLMNGLYHMHQKGFVHRDLKPQNLLLTEDFILKVGDFGFSCHKTKHNGVLKSKLGTHGYMAPEIYQQKYDGEKVDVFAVGVILFVMFVGGSPFSKATKQDAFYAFIIKKQYDKFWKEFEKRTGKNFFDPQFKDLFEKMVAYDPNERLTIPQIAQHPWIGGDIVDYNELKADFEKRKTKVEEAIEKRRVEEEKKKQEAKKHMMSEEGNIRGSQTSEIENFVEEMRAEGHLNRKLQVIEWLDCDDMVVDEELSYVVVRLKELLTSMELDLNADPLQDAVSSSGQVLRLQKLQDNKTSEILAEFRYQRTIGEEEEIVVEKLVVRFGLGRSVGGKVVLRCESEEGDWFNCRRVIGEVRKVFAC